MRRNGAFLRGCTLSIAFAAALAACEGGGRPAGEAGAPDTAPAATAEAPRSIIVAEVGFQTPESVLHDPTADVYIVANINGNPTSKDNNGFLSRVTPDGQVAELKWVEGGQNGVTLHAPKGMAIKGDTLFVADIDTVRMFHRETGAVLGARGVPGATFLNDMAVGPDGTVYVSDSGLRGGAQGLEPAGTDAVYRFGPDGAPQALARGSQLQNPNGLAVDEQGVIVVPFGGNRPLRIDASGNITAMDSLPAGQLDGLVRLDDGSLLVSSWEGRAVYHLMPGMAHTMTAVSDVEAPADIGYDRGRNRVLIPLFTSDRLDIRAVQM
jgi:sugar lactone lactonase YvrE